MTVTVRFQIDAKTGEVKMLQIDQDKTAGPADHERAHNRVAASIGNVVGRRPAIIEVDPTEPQPVIQPVTDDAGKTTDTGEKETRKVMRNVP